MLLVRHGQSTWNEARRWQGQADPPLTDFGARQAFDASLRLGAVDAIFSSTLERARSTAAIISNQLGVGPVVSLAEIRERNAGDWQGMTRGEIEQEYPGYLAENRRPPGWEPDSELQERVFTAFDEICSAWPEGEVLVVTHGGVIYQVESALGAAFERISNLGTRRLFGDAEGYRLGDRLELLDEDEITVPEQI